MHSDIYHESENLTYSGTLKGPRPNTYRRKPLEIRLPLKNTTPERSYTYPRPSQQRRISKTEMYDELPSPAPISSAKVINESTSLPCREKKKLPPRPAIKSLVFKKPVHYSSSDEEELDDEEILRDLSLSREISVDDIKISDDEVDEEEEDDEPPVIPPPPPTKKTDLPPIPTIVAPDSSDDEDTPSKNIPSVPTLVIPGETSDDEEEDDDTTSQNSSDLYDSIYYGVRCAGCRKPLSGDAITTSNKSWHPKCLKCQKCHIKLEHIQYYEKDGLPYCALDYHDLFSPRCDHCKTPIESGRWLTALNKNYHVGHLFCRECGKPFEEGASYSEREGHVYCEEDYQKLFAMKCKGCGEGISREYITALDGSWHKECFVCVDCGSFITSSTFMVKGGKPHCGKNCQNTRKKRMPIIPTLTALPDLESIPQPTTATTISEDQNARTCHKCQKIIQARYSSAFGFDYHPLHFQCSQCNKLLSERLVGNV